MNALFVATRGLAARCVFAFLVSALSIATALAACSGTSPNIVCTSNAGVIGLNAFIGGTNPPLPRVATVYPSENIVTGLTGTITSVGVRLNGLTHDWGHDLQMVLVSPTGIPFVFWSNVGPANNATAVIFSNETFTISDSAANDLPQSDPPAGAYRSRKYTTQVHTWPNPANITAASGNSAAPFGTQTFATRFAGLNPNGTWQLYIIIVGAPDSGSLQSWDLLFATAANNAATTTSLTSNVNPSLIPSNNSVIFTATVTSNGNPVTLGTVQFFRAGNIPIGSAVNLNGLGQAGVNVTQLPEGVHTISAVYSGASGFGASQASLTQTVDRATQVSGNTFCNTGTIAVPISIGQPSSVYPSKLFVAGLSGSTQTVVMDIKGFTAPQSEDINLLLVSPTGQKFIPFAYVSNTSATSGANIKLDDASSNVLADSGAITSGTYKPNYGIFGTGGFLTATFVSPAPAAPYAEPAPKGTATFSSAFAGASPNGTWTLFAANGGGGGPATARELTNGWCLTFTTTPPDLTITKTAVGSGFRQGGTVSYNIVVTNSGTGPTSGTITVTDVIPTGLTVTSATGTNWTCTGSSTVSCTSTTPIAANGGTSTITLAANIAANAPSSITNTVTVSGGGETNTGNNAGTSVISVTQLAPDLTIAKVAQGAPFQQGGTVTYMITVTNSGNGPTSGTITVTDVIPTGLTVTNAVGPFNCSGSSTVTCTSSTPIPANGNASITLSANIATNAPASITNTATVSGGGETNTGNNSGTSVISVTQLAPDLTISKVAQSGPFQQGGTVTYLLTVTNSGNGPSSGQITVTDVIPTGLTVTSATGTNWSCTGITQVTCTRTTAIPAGGTSVITLVANIANNAPPSITNTATVSGGGETVTNNNAGSSVISVGVPAALTVTVSGNAWGSVVSTPSGINCPRACVANFAAGSVVTLTRQVNAANDGEFVGWTDPATCASAANSSNPTCEVTMNGAQTAAARFTVTCRLDADGDNAVLASTDALMITRRILGVTGATVIAGAFNPTGSRNTESLINTYIAPRISENRFDINLDGVTDWRDAAILLRVTNGFTGTAALEGLITPASQRRLWDQPTPGGASDGVKQYLNNRCALAIP
jgi:uncharacterized repeat protein (TIGR01451 family)